MKHLVRNLRLAKKFGDTVLAEAIYNTIVRDLEKAHDDKMLTQQSVKKRKEFIKQYV